MKDRKVETAIASFDITLWYYVSQAYQLKMRMSSERADMLVHALNGIQISSDRSSWHSNCVVKALGLQYVNDAYVVFYLSAYCAGPTI